ncbi:hypothetical protein MAR_024497 [Mya arenaria]|uniref:Uncharacterized protein n=1 Tax=Mya arenaria TaxID=6604 RepID=A0ABY7DR03_MYAAR|nr:hypothetical protein MAR_024497 [Mya arenaria]
MSSQRGNVKKSGPPKYQNKRGFKNVYHDTRTFMRLQEKGMLTSLGDPKAGGVEEYDDEDSNDELENEDTDADGSGMAPHDALDEVPDHTVAGIKASVTLGHDVTETPCLSDVAETKTATDRKSDDADLCAQTVDLNISSKENVES